jgi:mevalonate pyrophosphate decarboxylase
MSRETIETYPDSLELSNLAQIISGSMSRETTETYPDSLELSNLAQIISGSISSSLSRPKKNITKLYL